MINKLNLFFSILFSLFSLIFYFVPELDKVVSGIFYSVGTGFAYSNNFFVMFLFKTVPAITVIFAVVVIVLIARTFIKERHNTRKIGLYLAIVFSLAIGPGVITNTILKDNFGRARPKQITEFGGQKTFSKVYEISDQCIKNCSFCSGHAAAAFSLSSIAFLVAPQYQTIVYFLGMFYGFVVGFGRVIQGGHFISDVVVSAWIVLIINYLFIRIYYKIFEK